MEPIAIIGVACLFPDAATPAAFWQNLVQGLDSTSEATAAEMGVDPDLYYDPTGRQTDTYSCKRGAYIRDFSFDSSGYAIAPEVLDQLDNTYQWSLYVAREALRDSGYLGRAAQLMSCGVLLGTLSFPTRTSNQQMLPIYRTAIENALGDLLQQPMTLPHSPRTGEHVENVAFGSGTYAATTAQALGLGGVSFELDAACASSLYAMKLACDALNSGDTDLMLAGAVSAADPFFINMGFSSFQAYPQDGVSRPFDRDAGGLIAGEGAGMFVLKRYADARRDGDQIYAVIRGIGLSNDGKGKSLLSPHPKGQMLAYQRAYRAANLDPQAIDYVECHATGTQLGDQTELNTLAEFFGAHGAVPLIGSVKSNLGHLLTAAGMAGMLKVILSMAQRQIPATININHPITLDRAPLTQSKESVQIVRTLQPWPQHAGPRQAAVSAFGFGGTNAHLILEEPGASFAEEQKTGFDQEATDVQTAIVGMDACFGGCDGLEAFAQTIYEGKQHFGPLPSRRWKGIDQEASLLQRYGFADGRAPTGAYLSEFAFDFLRFGIPPKAEDQPIPQQLLMLKVADRAIDDAALARGQNVAVIVAMNTDPTLHRFRGRCDLLWQIDAALAQQGSPLTAGEKAELIALAKSSIYPAATAAQYASLIGNIMAGRIAAQWDFSGPAFTVSTQENGTFHALAVAAGLLADKSVDAVVVGAVELAGSPEAILLRNQQWPVNSGAQSLSLAEGANGWLVGEGAGAVVLKRRADAQTAHEHIYAIIEAITVAQNSPTAPGHQPLTATPAISTVVQACGKALQQAQIAPTAIGYLELCGSGLPPQDAIELSGIQQAYAALSAALPEVSVNEPQCAVGSVKANIGHTFAASGMASLIKSALCLQQRFLPATPGWTAPKIPAAWDARFYLPTLSRPWLHNHGKDMPPRTAAISGLGIDGSCAHLILTESPLLATEPAQRTTAGDSDLTTTPPYLFLLAGDTQALLAQQLTALAQTAADCAHGGDGPLPRVAERCFARFQRDTQARYTLALVAHTPEELQREIERAQEGIAQTFASDSHESKEWKTPLGSYFTANPLGPQGEIAFVYPGIFNSYLGMGRDLFRLFPALLDYLETLTPRPSEAFAEHYLYPRTSTKLSEAAAKARLAHFMRDGHAMLESGSLFAVLLTHLLANDFGLRPAQAFGYSLGESAMLLALGAWPIREQDRLNFRTSPLFQTRIAGRKEAVRANWQLPPSVADDAFWAIHTLRAVPEQVAEALQSEERVYLTHINTPREVVIAGDPQGCERLIDRLQCDAMQAPFNNVIHCEPMQSEYGELLQINTRPLQPTTDIRFHFAANADDAPVTAQSVAHWIAQGCCQSLDFPHLVKRVYNAGARIFVEVGARSTCSRWIHDILGAQPHLAVAVNHTRQRDRTALVQLMAQLASHRAAVDLTALYAKEDTKEAEPTTTQRSLVKMIPLGGDAIADLILSAENRRRFGDLLVQQKVERQHAHEQTEQSRAQLLTAQLPDEQAEEQKALYPVAMTATAQSRVAAGPPNPVGQEVLPSAPARDGSENGSAHGLANHPQLALLREQIALVTRNHRALLTMRRAASRHMEELIRLQLQHAQPVPPAPQETLSDTTPPTEPTGAQSIDVVWDEADLLEFAEGDIANVFGPDYALIDSYARRVRLPMPPYLLVSRVTQLDATRGDYRPSFMQTEYDVPQNAWYSVDGQVPTAVAVESGQCDLLLISYIGIDFENQGVLVYRLLDCSLTFRGKLPHAGQTLRYDIQIDSYARSGNNLLFFFQYDCYADGELILEMRNGCAGFFSDADLAQGKGVVLTEAERTARTQLQKRHFPPLLHCHKVTFTRAEFHQLSRGDLAACFGTGYGQAGLNPSLRYPAPAMIMLDRITAVEPTAGAWGLGKLIAEQDLAPDNWYFPCHFKDDEVLAGSLMAEGCVQLLQFYMLYLGLQTATQDAHFQPIPDLKQVVRCRGQVTPRDTKLHYELEITDVGLSPHPYIKGYARLILNGKVIVDFQNLGLQLVEKDPTCEFLPHREADHAPTTHDATCKTQQQAQFSAYHITEFATGSLVNCFGPDFAVYEQPHRRSSRTPNGDLQLLSRVLYIAGERLRFDNQPSLVSEYDVPSAPWFVPQETAPTIPYAIYMEIALQPCGFLSAYLGSTLLFPEQDFQFRNLDGTGELLAELDLRGRTITNQVRLVASTALEGVIIQEFAFAMYCEGQLFYRGTASFGYFTAQALVAQRGLDGGNLTPTWLEKEKVPPEQIQPIDRHRRPRAAHGARPLDTQMPWGQLHFLASCRIVPGGGTHGKGYIQGRLAVTPDDWFFACHFYQDPVMPGSLGVEAIIEAMKEFACDQGLGNHFRSPRFTQCRQHETIWKYRGQIVPGEGPVTLEVHVTALEMTPQAVTVVGDANLWKNGLRIYAVQQVAIAIREQDVSGGNEG